MTSAVIENEHSPAYASINGNDLRYELRNHGPLVVFGHGLMGRIEQVDTYLAGLEELTSKLRMLVYDARGHGESNGPEDARGYTWATLGQDIGELIRFTGEDRAIVGGVSMGAAASIWLAVEQPERVRALVTLMPPPLGLLSQRTEGERRAITALDFLASAVENYGLETALQVVRSVPGFASTPEDADERIAWLRGQNPLTLRYAIRGLIDAPPHDPECYRRIKAPTLVFGHEGDDLHPARAARLLAENVPGSRLLMGPTPDYWMKHKPELLAEMLRFLNEVR